MTNVTVEVFGPDARLLAIKAQEAKASADRAAASEINSGQSAVLARRWASLPLDDVDPANFPGEKSALMRAREAAVSAASAARDLVSFTDVAVRERLASQASFAIERAAMEARTTAESGKAAQSAIVAQGWAEGPVPPGGGRSSKGWAQVAQAGAALADTARAAVEQAISQVPTDTRILLEAVTVSVLRDVAPDTPIGRLAYLAEPGREGVWQLRAGDYSAQIAADVYGTRYVKVTAVAEISRAWVRIIADNTFRFSWTGLDVGTANARTFLQAGLDMFDPNARWVLPNHKMIIPDGNASLEIRKPGVTLEGFGRGTHLDYQGNAGQFLGLGLFLVSASGITVENMHFSLYAPGNSASNPACVGVSYTKPFLDTTTGTLPKLAGTKIRGISCERTSLGVIVGAFDRTNRADGGIGQPEDTTIEDFQVTTNGAAVSLFGAGATEARFYDLRWDSSLPLASPSAKQCGFRILGASDIRLGDGKIRDFLQGFTVEPDGSRITNRRVDVYGHVAMSNVKQPVLVTECLEWFRVSGRIDAKRDLTNTEAYPVVSVVSDQFLSAVDQSLPPEQKVSFVDDVDIRNIKAEGYASFLSQQGKMKKLTIEQNQVVGNAYVSSTFGTMYAVICRDPFGIPTVTKVNDNDFRLASSPTTSSLTLRASTGLIEAQRNLLPERSDPQSAIQVDANSVFYSNGVQQRPFGGVVNLGTNRLHPVGALANYQSGTPVPLALPASVPWARDTSIATVTESPANTFTKTGAAAAYDGRVSSMVGLIGDFEIVYRLNQIASVDGSILVGIDGDANSLNPNSIDWFISYAPGVSSGATPYGIARPYTLGTALSIGAAYGVGTIERWRREGSRLIFSRGNVDLFSTTTSPDIAFKLQILFARQNDAVEILRFAPI